MKNPSPRPPSWAGVDRILCGKWGYLCFGLLFGLLLGGVAFFSGGVTARLMGRVEEIGGGWIGRALLALGVPAGARDFAVSALWGGWMSVVGFLPALWFLFFGIACLEDSGYGARAVFLFDRPLRLLGLRGESAFPLLMGLGCTVTGALSCRTVPTDRARSRTLGLLPCLSCSAKLPVYLWLLSSVGGSLSVWWVFLLYLTGVFALLSQSALFLRLERVAKRKLKVAEAHARARPPQPRTPSAAPLSTPDLSHPDPAAEDLFLLEMPPLRLPSPRVASAKATRQTAQFLRRTCGVIVLFSALLWVLSRLGPGFRPAADPAGSLLALFCRFPARLLAPVGCDDWRFAAALLSGLGGKETVAASLGQLFGGAALSPAEVLPFSLLVLLWPPCLHALGVLFRETPDRRHLCLALGWQILFGWLAAWAVHLLFG